MKIEEQVCSIEQMKELEQLGFDTNKASMAWYKFETEDSNEEDEDWWVISHVESCTEISQTYFPTFSIGEMLEMLPESIKKYDADWEETYEYFLSISKEDGKWQIVYKFYSYILERDEMVYSSTADSLRDALFAELKTLKENKEI